MTTTKTEKPKTDLTGIMGEPNGGGGSFLDSMKQAIQNSGAKVEQPAPTPAPGLLGTIKSGRDIGPPRILLVGTEGIGKSTWAASAPKPIFIQTEDGLGTINCDKFPLVKSFREVTAQLSTLANEPHGYETVVIDSVDWLERLIWDSVCERTGKKNIEDIGYAKGYIFALDEWREMLSLLVRCRARGMAVILIAHAKIEKFEDPENPTYDRYSPRLHKHAQALLTEWVDAVLFATRRMAVKREGKGTDERTIAAPVGANGGDRIIRTVGSPACLAKNRYNLQPEIQLTWAAFEAGLVNFMKGN